MKYSQVVPAIIPTNQKDVIEASKNLRFSREFHLDIVDGIFVPTVSWPYEPIGDSMAVKSALDVYTLEVDLMTVDPILAANKWLLAGADMLVFHTETISVEVFKNFTENTSVSVGISCSGDTPIETLFDYIRFADYVQLMGIYQIGSQGQPFTEVVFDKIAKLKKHFPDMMISVDGGVNSFTIKKLRDAGADRFIVGSAIVKQIDPEKAHSDLLTLINE